MSEPQPLLLRITQDPGKCGGRPCVRHMRIRVQDVLELMAAGVSNEEILADFPDLEADDLSAIEEFGLQPRGNAAMV